MERILRFGIVGCGMISRWHAEAIRRVPGAVLAGVCDAQMERAEKFAGEYGAAAFPALDGLLASEIDAVCICTPSGLHASQAAAAALAGKHVLVEKPVGLTLAELSQVRAACRASGTVLGTVSQLLFSPDVCRLKKALEEHALGRILLCDLSMDFWREPAYYQQSPWRGTWKMDGGGALMNQGIHGISLLLHLMGGVRAVTAQTRTSFHSIETEDTAAALVEFQNGAVGTIHASTAAYPGSPRVLRISGSAGTAELTEDRLTRWALPAESWIREASETAASDPQALGWEGHRLQLEDFVRAIREGQQPQAGLEEGCRPVELILSMYRSAETGRRVEVENFRLGACG